MTINLSLTQTGNLTEFGRALYQALVSAGQPDMASEAAAIVGRFHDVQDYLLAVLERYDELRVEWAEACH